MDLLKEILQRLGDTLQVPALMAHWIWPVMSGNGFQIGMMHIQEIQKKIHLTAPKIGCCEAVHGAITRAIFALLFDSLVFRSIPTISLVFVVRWMLNKYNGPRFTWSNHGVLVLLLHRLCHLIFHGMIQILGFQLTQSIAWRFEVVR